jgi:hypothetical protein
MQNVEASGPQLLINPAVGFPRPHGAQRGPHIPQLLYTMIVFFQQLNFMTVIAQESNLGGSGMVFAARQQIPVMEHENFHLY